MNIPRAIDRLRHGVVSFLRTTLAAVLGLVVFAIGEAIPPLRDLHAFISEREGLMQSLIALTVSVVLVGALILALAQFLPAPRPPDSMSQTELEALSPPILFSEARSRGERRVSRSFSGEASIAAVKEAWRLKSWRYDRRWRIVFVMMLGAALVLFGLFGLWLVIGSAGIKLLMGSLLLYALVRTAWAFMRA